MEEFVNQRTIEKEVTLKGIGLHTGDKVTITFKPAEADAGINFIRTDLAGKPGISCSVDNIMCKSGSLRCTILGKEEAQVITIEHLMAALCGLGIDNLTIEIDAGEVPGLDGSSKDFLEALTRAGVKEQQKPRHFLSVREPIFAEEDGSSIIVLPSDDYKISYTLDYNHPFINVEFFQLDINSRTFKDEIAQARTFCLEDEVDQLKDQGFGKGANYDNTLVVGKSGIIKNKLRYENEFIRHKILDLVGDLYLLGQPLKGHVIALRSGHSLNTKLLKKLKQQNQKSQAGGISVSGYCPSDGELDANEIMKILPHRPPFLFVDRILSLEKGKSAVGLKNVSINDYFFAGHFPGKPVMPGVLIIEAMAQVGGVMMLASEENRGKIAYFMSINNVKFRKLVVPGDQLVFKLTAVKVKSRTGQVRGEAYVGDKIVAEADLMFSLGDSEK